jgi:hypothetical protein
MKTYKVTFYFKKARFTIEAKDEDEAEAKVLESEEFMNLPIEVHSIDVREIK